VRIPQHSILAATPSQWLFSLQNPIVQGNLNFLPAAFIMFLVAVVFEPLAIAGFTYVTRKTLVHEACSIQGIMDITLMRWNFLWITAALHLLILLAGTLLIIPGIYFSVVFVFHSMVVAEHGRWGFGALAYSARLVKGRFFKTLGIVFIIQLLMFWFNFLLSMGLYSYNLTNSLANIAILTLRDVFTAYFHIVIIVYFFRLSSQKH